MEYTELHLCGKDKSGLPLASASDFPDFAAAAANFRRLGVSV
jgi:hypothetical protein